jgi:hypothetical protein
MAISNLTGQKTSKSFQNLLQISSSGALYDGTGSLVTNLIASSSYAPTASYAVNTTSSSYAVTASYATQALSASWAPTTNPFPFTGSAQITGSLGVTGSLGIRYNTPSSNGITITGHYPALRLVNTGSGAIAAGGVITVQDNNFVSKVQGQAVMALTVVDNTSTIKGNITWTKDSINATNTAFNYNNFNNTAIYISGSGDVGIRTTTPNSASLHVSGNVWATSFTGSLFGTASFAQTASYAPNYIEKSVGPTYTTNAILTVTQAEYDAIDPKDSTTLYFII